MYSSILLLSLFFCFTLQGITIPDLRHNPYGFAFVEEGLSSSDLARFEALDIQRDRIFHHFGDLPTLQTEMAGFFSEIGGNDALVSDQLANQLLPLVHEVIRASGRQTAWVFLRAFTPTSAYDLPRWHFDGHYYIPSDADDLMFKFVLTLKGTSTLFYLLPPQHRKMAESHISNRHYMKKFCLPHHTIKPRTGQGAIFVAGQGPGMAALHSEPPIHETRLFLSIVPCLERELPSLKSRILSVYPKDSRD